MLVAVSVASVLLVNKAREDNAWVVHTVEVESQVANLLVDIRRTESATRAYLLTSAPQYLSEYRSAAAGLPAALGHLDQRLQMIECRRFLQRDDQPDAASREPPRFRHVVRPFRRGYRNKNRSGFAIGFARTCRFSCSGIRRRSMRCPDRWGRNCLFCNRSFICVRLV